MQGGNDKCVLEILRPDKSGFRMTIFSGDNQMCENCGCGGDEKSFKDKVAEIIESIRPMLQNDGGDIELVGIDQDNNVNVRLQGACRGCPGAAMTLKMGVERLLKERVPEVKEVIAVD